MASAPTIGTASQNRQQLLQEQGLLDLEQISQVEDAITLRGRASGADYKLRSRLRSPLGRDELVLTSTTFLYVQLYTRCLSAHFIILGRFQSSGVTGVGRQRRRRPRRPHLSTLRVSHVGSDFFCSNSDDSLVFSTPVVCPPSNNSNRKTHVEAKKGRLVSPCKRHNRAAELKIVLEDTYAQLQAKMDVKIRDKQASSSATVGPTSRDGDVGEMRQHSVRQGRPLAALHALDQSSSQGEYGRRRAQAPRHRPLPSLRRGVAVCEDDSDQLV